MLCPCCWKRGSYKIESSFWNTFLFFVCVPFCFVSFFIHPHIHTDSQWYDMVWFSASLWVCYDDGKKCICFKLLNMNDGEKCARAFISVSKKTITITKYTRYLCLTHSCRHLPFLFDRIQYVLVPSLRNILLGNT